MLDFLVLVSSKHTCNDRLFSSHHHSQKTRGLGHCSRHNCVRVLLWKAPTIVCTTKLIQDHRGVLAYRSDIQMATIIHVVEVMEISGYGCDTSLSGLPSQFSPTGLYFKHRHDFGVVCCSHLNNIFTFHCTVFVRPRSLVHQDHSSVVVAFPAHLTEQSIDMDIPWLPFPPTSLRKSIMPEEWQICLDSWLLLAQNHLLLSTKVFSLNITKIPSLVQFLVSYVKNSSEPANAKENELRKKSFLLIHRILSEVKPTPQVLLDWKFLADLSRVYVKSTVLSSLLVDVWRQETLEESLSMRTHKAYLIRELEHGLVSGDSEELLASVVALLRTCYPYGQFLMLGSDLIDALSIAFKNAENPTMRNKVVTVAYFSLLSLLEPEQSRISTLLDQLYSLKATTEDVSLLKTVVGSTPFLQKMQTQISGPETTRARSLMEFLKAFEKLPDGRSKKPVRRKIEKGKWKDLNQYGHDSTGGLHVHKLSLVAQVQDLFPDLGSAFIVKLLDEYNDDTEQVTAHLLDDSLPPHLNALDRTENLPQGTTTTQTHDLAPGLEPHPTPPLRPTRRNIHDNDDFDRLAIDTSKLALGRKNADLTADKLLSAQRPSSQKAAILSALAAFDSDDDERDDTYDAEDVGGTVDATNDDNAGERREEVHEEALFNAYKMSPEAFNRDSDTRRGKYRAALKSETGMTDEAIEGWGIMAARDPRRLRRLERKYEMAGGAASQTQLGRSSWTADSAAEGTEDSDAGGIARSGRGGRARGRGRGRGGAGVAGPSDDKDTQVARQRKDANKGSRANHNRRDQRARKMGRGGLMG